MCENVFDKEALDPRHICEIFQKTIENINIPIQVKLIFYKLFDQEVCSKLGVMYKTVNQIFIDNGIMPEIIMKTTKNEEVDDYEEEVSSRVASYYDPTENIATDFIPRSKQDVSRIVNEFMTGGMTITGDEIELPESFLRVPTKQDLEGKNCYERKEVLRALSNLQRKLTSLQDFTECLTTEKIKQELLADIGKDHGGVVDKNVNLLDERSIDFVGMMFGAITDDDTISELMTNLIYQLQIPVMKIAMSDNTLFENEDHPARATVDLLATAGKGINQREDHLYNELEEVVDSILDNFDIDIEAFEKAKAKLEDLINKEEQATKETERKQQKQILQAHAKNIVINQLKMVTCNKKIPNQVRPLVLKNWSTLMLNRYIRHGRESAQWVESVMLLKLLLKCIQPISYPSQYNLVKNNHLALIEAVNDELYQTRQDKNEIAEQIATLKSHFIKMLDDYGYKIVDENNEEIKEEELIEDTADDNEEELLRIQQQTEIARQKIAQLASTNKPGVWYELYNGEDKPVRRLKLSVILTDAAQLIFVDRKGIKVIEKDAEDFARELEENRSRVLADHSTFDHALGNVIKAFAA
jgi:polyhydroxyalkanoate synthesis regulator phasin